MDDSVISYSKDNEEDEGIENITHSPQTFSSKNTISKRNSSLKDIEKKAAPEMFHENWNVANSSCVVIEDSDEEDTGCPINPDQVKSSSTPSKASERHLLQPKISALVKKFVSQEYFDEQCTKLNELEMDLVKSTHLVDTMKSKLPDGGRRLSGRIDELNEKIRVQMTYLSTLEVQTSSNQIRSPHFPAVDPTVMKKAILLPVEPLSWADLDAGVSSVQPKFTGRVGLKNFNEQKCMTMERLKDIHGSLDTCPSINEMATDPTDLKIPLMPHQRHALKWMEWRENQKPRGGILADDMGLGKTLTCIAHVLAYQELKENRESASHSNVESTDDDDEEKEEVNMTSKSKGWSSKGRRDCKFF